VAAQFFVNGALFASFLPRMPEIRDHVDISIARVGLLMSIAGFAGLVGSAAAGPAIARFGTRRVMLGGGSIIAVSLPIVGLANTQVALLVGLVAMLTFDAPVDVAMNLQGSWLSARRHAPVMNRLHGLWSLGAAVGGLSSSRIAASGVSLSVHLTMAGAVLLMVVIVVSRGVLQTDEHPVPEVQGGSTAPAGATARRSPPAVLLLFALAGFTALAIEATSIDWAAFRLSDDLGSGAGFAALGYAAVTTGMTIGRFGGDWVAHRVGPARLSGWASAVTAAGLVIATLVDNRHLVLTGYLLAGVGIATMLPTIYDQAAKHPGRPGAGLGALTAGLRLAILTVPFIVGTIAATDLSVGSAVAIVTLPSVAGFVVVGRALQRSS